jgi:hypothetical protein
MLQDAQMTAMRKLRCGVLAADQWQVWAEPVVQGDPFQQIML